MRKHIIGVVLILMASLYMLQVSAGPIYEYQTVLDLGAGGADGIDSVVIDWNTMKNTGAVGASDLSYLSIAFLSGAANLFADIAIVGGVVQSLGGAARPTTDVDFGFDHNTNLLNGIRNAFFATLASSLGTVYKIEDGITIPIDGNVSIEKFVDGVSTIFSIPDVTFQNTTLLRVTGVPEPVSLVIMSLGLLGLGFARSKKST